MATAPATSKSPSIGQFGTIQGGLLHGWSYAFSRVLYIGGRLHYELIVAQPSWPFPKTVHFGKGDFRRLAPGLRAKRLEIRPLIEDARKLALTGKQK